MLVAAAAVAVRLEAQQVVAAVLVAVELEEAIPEKQELTAQQILAAAVVVMVVLTIVELLAQAVQAS
jgi:hypothetical protein